MPQRRPVAAERPLGFLIRTASDGCNLHVKSQVDGNSDTGAFLNFWSVRSSELEFLMNSIRIQEFRNSGIHASNS